MLAVNRIALKEWSTVCDRVASGEHVLLIRKGGLIERRGGFRVEHREFFLFPTRFHEKGEAPPGEVMLGPYASVEEDLTVADLEALRRLEGQHGVPWPDVEKRFHYGREKGVHVLALRAWRLARPPVVDNARAFEGCTSWVELERELPVEPSGPALAEEDFSRKLEALRAALRG
jgi:hypothetical protein